MSVIDADSLVAEGRLLEAVEALTSANRTHPDPAVEARLVRLRHEAFSELAGAEGRPSWPPDLPDPFPEVEGIPEIAVDDLDGEVVGGAILHHGSVIVRGLVDPERAAHLVEGIDRAFENHDRRTDGVPVEETAPWYVPFAAGKEYSLTFGERWWIRNGGGVWTADSPRMFFDLVEAFEQVGLRDVLAAYLGERPALSVKKCTLRRVPIDTGTDWHQDGAFLGEGIRTVNVWLALTHCGDDAPGIDVVPTRLPLLETGTLGAQFDWSVGPGMVEKVEVDAPVVRPIFEVGDALLFDERNLHRTGVSPGMTRERYAIESWFFAPSKYPHDQIPIAF